MAKKSLVSRTYIYGHEFVLERHTRGSTPGVPLILTHLDMLLHCKDFDDGRVLEQGYDGNHDGLQDRQTESNQCCQKTINKATVPVHLAT